MKILTKKLMAPLWDLFFNGICPHCDYHTLQPGQNICLHCFKIFEKERTLNNLMDSFSSAENGGHCPRCGFPHEEIASWSRRLNPVLENESGCIQCYDRVIYYDSFNYIFKKSDWIKKALGKLKFHGEKYMIPSFQETVYNYWQMNKKDYDYWLPVPVSALTLRQRNFNQVDLIFELLSCDLPKGVFLRKKDAKIQSQFGRHNRFLHIGSAYHLIAKRSRDINDKHLLLVDDICTSGSTVNYLASLLKGNGAAKVDVLIFFQSTHL